LHPYKCNQIITYGYNYVKNFRNYGERMNKEIETRIGQNIRRLREKVNMTQDTLAARLQVNGCDITRSAVAKIEVGQRHLYPDELMLIKQILRVEYEDIFQMDD